MGLLRSLARRRAHSDFRQLSKSLPEGEEALGWILAHFTSGSGSMVNLTVTSQAVWIRGRRVEGGMAYEDLPGVEWDPSLKLLTFTMPTGVAMRWQVVESEPADLAEHVVDHWNAQRSH